MRRFWQSEFPVGNATRGAPFGERTDPVTLTTLATYASVASAGVGILGATGVLGGGKDSSAPPAPTVSKPTVMPSPDDDAMKMAKKKSLAGQLARRGRQSTVLESDTSGDLLGA